MIKNSENGKTKFFRLSVGALQKEFIDELIKITKMKSGSLICQALLFAEKKEIRTSFLDEYINFIHDKKYGIPVAFLKEMNTHETLKNLDESYKKQGYNIKIKGVVLLYLLYYAKNYLNIDISKYKNFN